MWGVRTLLVDPKERRKSIVMGPENAQKEKQAETTCSPLLPSVHSSLPSSPSPHALIAFYSSVSSDSISTLCQRRSSLLFFFSHF